MVFISAGTVAWNRLVNVKIFVNWVCILWYSKNPESELLKHGSHHFHSPNGCQFFSSSSLVNFLTNSNTNPLDKQNKVEFVFEYSFLHLSEWRFDVFIDRLKKSNYRITSDVTSEFEFHFGRVTWYRELQFAFPPEVTATFPGIIPVWYVWKHSSCISGPATCNSACDPAPFARSRSGETLFIMTSA